MAPGPGDESLSIGACYAALMEKYGEKYASKNIVSPSNAYWGDEVSEKELLKFKSNKLIKKILKQKKILILNLQQKH